jgi:1-acyl-sn-glycerol-3-phosphate acyltransferase
MSTDAQKTARSGPGQRSIAALWVLLRSIHSLYAGLVFLSLALLGLSVMLLLPWLLARRAIARFTGRLALTLSLMPVSARLPDRLPEPCIVVANHESYLDGIVLCALLPTRFGFVIKREMSRVPIAGLLLARLGAQFVERGTRGGSTRDALRVLREAQRGASLVFFPEGTFRAEPGLMHFHVGAFAAAERARAPVLPLVIRGTRHCLPPESALVRPGRIRVEALALLEPGGGTHDAAVLRAAAHAAIATALADPAAAAGHAPAGKTLD